MLTIRLSRTGKKRQPYYRIIVLEKQKDPWGDYLELLGQYNPRSKDLNIKEDRLKYWISVGAQPSNSLHNLLVKEGILEGDKKKSVTITQKRQAKMDEQKQAKEEAKQAEEEKAQAEKDSADKKEQATETSQADDSAQEEAKTDEDKSSTDKEEVPAEDKKDQSAEEEKEGEDKEKQEDKTEEKQEDKTEDKKEE